MRCGRTVVGFALLTLAVVSGCGEAKFSVSNESYEPRIVIEGILQPGAAVERVHIWRNFPVDAEMGELDLVPDDTRAVIIDVESGSEYPLSFHHGQAVKTLYFENRDLTVEHGKTYTLDVEATIDGQALHAWATTTVPMPGFRIVGVNHDQLPYRPLSEDGTPVNFEVTIERNPSSRLYLATMAVAPEVADTSNFVYDNPYTDQKPREVLEDFADFAYGWDWIQNVPSEPGESTIELPWYFFWFYGEHEITVYATDRNYEDFLQTFDDAQEEDGNFHEPGFSIEGDGIGVFGSAAVDRMRVEVLRE